MGDKILLTLFEHKELLESLGYKIDSQVIDLLQKDGDFYKRARILFEGKRVGNLGIENKNMYYFEEDGQIVGNKDLSTIKFGPRRSKNMRTLVHTYIRHGSFYINCFNMLPNNEERNFICLTDNKTIKITKIVDEDRVEVKSLLEDETDDSILNSLRTKDIRHVLSYKIGDVLDEHKD